MSNISRTTPKPRPSGVSAIAIINGIAFLLTLAFWGMVAIEKRVPFPSELPVMSERANAAVTWGFLVGDIVFSASPRCHRLLVASFCARMDCGTNGKYPLGLFDDDNPHAGCFHSPFARWDDFSPLRTFCRLGYSLPLEAPRPLLGVREVRLAPRVLRFDEEIVHWGGFESPFIISELHR
jgi:hypothetical protein